MAGRWLARQGEKCCFSETVKGKLSELSNHIKKKSRCKCADTALLDTRRYDECEPRKKNETGLEAGDRAHAEEEGPEEDDLVEHRHQHQEVGQELRRRGGMGGGEAAVGEPECARVGSADTPVAVTGDAEGG